ncbi:MAG: NAD-dependent epimerase/dehydratase family protein [Lachnospiraceae bacterium]|nr:NAD-dependent epimerase/dehydratase family protein [Lachnospiraceae bacterium]
MKLLVIGGCGFLGSNLASHGIEAGYDVTVFDNLSRLGSSQNLEWLKTLGPFTYIHGDTRNKNDVETLIKQGQFDAVFHLAGQVAMTTSIENPYKDFEINTMGALNLLDSVRKYSPQTAILFSSTNKVYGDLDGYTYTETATRYVCNEFPNGFDESVPLDFRSPYGCSKGAADQYMLDFSRIFGIKTIVFRHSSMYGSRQFATYDQGWVGWFVQQAIEKYKNPNVSPFTISGNGKQVRDILHAKDMISLYYTALENVDTLYGQAYNIGGTMEQSLSLLELFNMLDGLLGIKMEYTMLPPRASDQKVFVADITKIRSKIQWEPKVSAIEGVSAMVEWVKGMNL